MQPVYHCARVQTLTLVNSVLSVCAHLACTCLYTMRSFVFTVVTSDDWIVFCASCSSAWKIGCV